jgi:Cd2+/Zn2+-exporting ATPase
MTENPGTAEPMDGDGRSETTVRLAVPEMDCPSCARKVDTSLQRVEGVSDTSLQPTTGTATVSYDADHATETDVIAAIEGAGYEVIGDENSSDEESANEMDIAPPSEIWTSSRAIATWLGAGMLAVGLFVAFLAGVNPVIATVFNYPLTLAEGLFALATVVSGVPVVRDGYYSAKNASLDIDLLMGTAIVAATAIGYFVEAATLAVLFSIAELLEDYAMDRARNSLRELMELSPEEATVLRNGEETTVPAAEVAVGETVVIRPGEKVPLDGVVIEGESAVDESPITGESVPADKSPDDEVYAGTIAAEGYLEVETTATAGESTLSQIIELVQGAQEQRTETERFVDRFAGYYTPLVVVAAILTAAVPPLALGWPWETWFIRGLTLLVIACPCAFVISTPVSVVSAVTSAAKNGVLVKGGNHLEAMGAVDVVALDKTGTLTQGELTVTDVIALGDHDKSAVLRHAGGLERWSEHPIAAAVLAHAGDAGIDDLPEPTGFESLTGKGIRGDIDGKTYYAGKPGLFAELGFDLSHHATDGGTAMAGHSSADASDALAELERDGKTVVVVGTRTELLGIVAIADEVRPGARETVERLHERGVEHVVMLTGDNDGTARAIAGAVGVDDYRAELLPDEKVEAIKELRAAHGSVGMVGDGINDAPALAAADVAIAMGAAGTDTALETADIALMGDDIGKLPYLYRLSRTASGVIRQNIWTSLGVKALLAVGVPLGYVSVALAVVVGDMGMSLGVTGNAMRLSRLKPERYRE